MIYNVYFDIFAVIIFFFRLFWLLRKRIFGKGKTLFSLYIVFLIDLDNKMSRKRRRLFHICVSIPYVVDVVLFLEAMERDLAEILRLSGEQERLWKAYEDWKGR